MAIAPEKLLAPDRGQDAVDLIPVDRKGFFDWRKTMTARAGAAVDAQGFKGDGYQIAILPGERENWSVAVGVADAGALGTWCLARAAESLPEGTYRLAGDSPGPAALGWALGQYGFDRYRKPRDPKGARILLSDQPATIDEIVAVADATFLVRDLVNLPAGALGPAELEQTARELAQKHGAQALVTKGDELAGGFPMIAAVGAAATQGRAPRLIEVEWGDPAAPRVAIIGKGVVFDTGGLDIKTSAGMRLMKKDMGGAAHALALAGLVMERRLPVRLHLLIPVAENAISGAALRPGDVLTSRQGLTVEIGNTDAEGRLILADAITRAAEAEPALMIDFATLTGAARVALGPDLPALFANDDALAADLLAAGDAVSDPAWRMPLWSAYGEMFTSDIADLNNAADGVFAGAVTAALFLQRFVPDGLAWAHFDTFAWRPAAKPGRPKGGDALGLRAAFAMLKARFG